MTRLEFTLLLSCFKLRKMEISKFTDLQLIICPFLATRLNKKKKKRLCVFSSVKRFVTVNISSKISDFNEIFVNSCSSEGFHRVKEKHSLKQNSNEIFELANVIANSSVCQDRLETTVVSVMRNNAANNSLLGFFVLVPS